MQTVAVRGNDECGAPETSGSTRRQARIAKTSNSDHRTDVAASTDHDGRNGTRTSSSTQSDTDGFSQTDTGNSSPTNTNTNNNDHSETSTEAPPQLPPS